MIHVELPHINVLSKIDLVEQYGKLGKVQWATKVVYTVLENEVDLIRYCISYITTDSSLICRVLRFNVV